ncbi:MAG: hypothetical protein ACREAB_20015 [Blastocatellia bacterium]
MDEALAVINAERAARAASISPIRKHEQAIKGVMLSVGCEPRHLRLIEWPVAISLAASTEYDHWRVMLNQEYERPKTLLPELRSLEELMPELFNDEGCTSK